jgi:hypothetical protein
MIQAVRRIAIKRMASRCNRSIYGSAKLTKRS